MSYFDVFQIYAIAQHIKTLLFNKSLAKITLGYTVSDNLQTRNNKCVELRIILSDLLLEFSNNKLHQIGCTFGIILMK